MAHPFPLEGLRKWAGRDPWYDLMIDLMTEHVAPACADAGISPQELEGVLEDDELHCLQAFVLEDLVTLVLEDGSNLADEYVERRSYRESARTRAFIAALRNSVASLYRVSAVEPDGGLVLRDALQDGPPVLVQDAAGHDLAVNRLFAGRVLEVDGRTMLSTAILPFEPALSVLMRKSLEEAARETDLSIAELLGETSGVFTVAWLDGLLTDRLGAADDEDAAGGAPGDDAEDEGLDPAAERELLHTALRAHLMAMLDEPNPVIGDLIPRKAAHTDKGRALVVAWLTDLETRMAEAPEGDPVYGFDVSWLWNELGLARP